MTSPRRPPSAGGRQPAASGRPSGAGRPSSPGRRPPRPGARTGRTSGSRSGPVPGAGSRPAGTRAGRRGRLGRLSPGRIAVLLLVVVTLVVSAALPLREFLSQRGEIADLAAANAEARERVAELAAERARQDDPEHVAAEARRRLHFVMPGETAYVVIPPPESLQDEAEQDAPWYDRLWDSVEQADRPSS